MVYAKPGHHCLPCIFSFLLGIILVDSEFCSLGGNSILQVPSLVFDSIICCIGYI